MELSQKVDERSRKIEVRRGRPQGPESHPRRAGPLHGPPRRAGRAGRISPRSCASRISVSGGRTISEARSRLYQR